jgi:hypothetical protein
MDDFLARENELLGDEFSGATGGTAGGGDFDFDQAASAFPDISLDADAPLPAAPVTTTPGVFMDAVPPMDTQRDVKITGGDEIDEFESQFPDLDVPAVRLLSLSRLKVKL